MPGARRLLFDTTAYVAALREGWDGPWNDRLEMALPRTYLSSVVAAELRAGAHDDAGRGLIDHLVFRFERVRRVIAPSAASWYDVGDALARVARREPGMRSKVHTLWNDALIAVSARQVGAAVVSDNVRDFTLLRRYLRFEIEGGS